MTIPVESVLVTAEMYQQGQPLRPPHLLATAMGPSLTPAGLWSPETAPSLRELPL